MRLLSKRQAPPEGAHGRRNIDGSYFAIWKHDCGNCMVGDVGKPGPPICFSCFERNVHRDGGHWTRCTREEAHRYVVRVDGFRGAYSGVGFELL